jgi:hypothetical protein
MDFPSNFAEVSFCRDSGNHPLPFLLAIASGAAGMAHQILA